MDIDKTMHVNSHLMVQRMHKIKHAQKSLELVPGVNRVSTEYWRSDKMSDVQDPSTAKQSISIKKCQSTNYRMTCTDS